MKRIIIISLALVSFTLSAFPQDTNPSELWIYGAAQMNMLYKSIYYLPPGHGFGQIGLDFKNSWIEANAYTIKGKAEFGSYYEQGIEVDLRQSLNKDLQFKGIIWPFFFSYAPASYRLGMVVGAELTSKAKQVSFGAIYAYLQPPAGDKKPYNGTYIYVSTQRPFLFGTCISGELGYNYKVFIRGQGVAANFGLSKDICFSDSVVLCLSWCHYLGDHAIMDPYKNDADVWAAKLNVKIF